MKSISEIIHTIKDNKIIPVVKLDSVEEAVPLAKALLNGGISIIEITFRTDSAAEGIKAIKATCPEMTVGAGTVINLDYAIKAQNAGAEFIVSPGFSEEVVDFCNTNGLLSIPGVITPTEIQMALEKDLYILKFFPASQFGGVPTNWPLY